MEVFEFGNYHAQFVTADTNHLIISMASRSHTEGQSRFEWSSTFSRIGLKSNFVYIKDVSNSWYTDLNGWEQLCEFLLAIIHERKIQWSAAFGLSMGAYGALLLAARLPLTRVIGFGPQTCIGQDALFDHRFQADWDAIKSSAITNTTNLNYDECEIVLFACSDDIIDLYHIRLFAEVGPLIQKFMFVDNHHFVHMHRSGALDEVLQHLLSGKRASETPYALRPNAAIYQFADEWLSGNPELAARNYFSRSDRDDKLFPQSLYPILFTQLAKEGVSAFPARHQQDLLYTYPEQYMPRGWLPVENWGRWSNGHEATIRFDLVDTCLPNKNFLRIDFVFLSVLKNTQRVVFRGGGGGGMANPQHVEMLAKNSTVHTVFVPVNSGGCEIVIETPDAATPRQRSGAPDDRVLGIGVIKLIVP